MSVYINESTTNLSLVSNSNASIVDGKRFTEFDYTSRFGKYLLYASHEHHKQAKVMRLCLVAFRQAAACNARCDLISGVPQQAITIPVTTIQWLLATRIGSRITDGQLKLESYEKRWFIHSAPEEKGVKVCPRANRWLTAQNFHQVLHVERQNWEL